MAWTWYTANQTTAEANKWRAFYRDAAGETIVDYSPSNVPSNAPPPGDVQQINEHVTVAKSLLSDARKFESLFAPYTAGQYAIDGSAKPTTENFRAGQTFLEKTPIDEASAIAIANAYLGDLPKDAKLEYVLPIKATWPDGTSMVLAYTVRYSRVLNGISLESNRWKNHIDVVVNNNAVAYTSKLWPQISQTRATQATPILSVNTAVQKAAVDLVNFVKTPVVITGVEPVLANDKNRIVPAYALINTAGDRIVVNASTGRVIR